LDKSWDYLEKFKNENLKSKSENTVSAYISDLKKLSEYFNKDFEEVTEEDIQKYINDLLNLKIKIKTINRKLVTIRKFIEFLNRNEFNIQIQIKLIKVQEYEYLQEVLEYKDFERLVRAAENAKDNRAVAIFYCLYYTGLRISEMLNLNVSDLNDEIINIKGKGSKYRKLSIRDKLREYLKEYISERKHQETDKLFINKIQNTPMTRQTVHNIIKWYAGKSKIKKKTAHAHNFRHLFALRLIESGAPIQDVQILLGHTNINTTTIYTKKTQKEIFNRLDKI
jgi:integrase/recombinase XerD